MWLGRRAGAEGETVSEKERNQAAEEQAVDRADQDGAKERAGGKGDEASVSKCECPPGCVGLPCCT